MVCTQMVLKQLVSNQWLLLSLLAYRYRKMTEHSYYTTRQLETMKHKLQDLVHTLTGYVNTVKVGDIDTSTQVTTHSSRSSRCSLSDSEIISSLTQEETSRLPTRTQTLVTLLSDLKALKQRHSRKIKQVN